MKMTGNFLLIMSFMKNYLLNPNSQHMIPDHQWLAPPTFYLSFWHVSLLCQREKYLQHKMHISLSLKNVCVEYGWLARQRNVYQISKMLDNKYEKEHLALYIIPFTRNNTYLLRTHHVLSPVQRLSGLPIVIQLVKSRQDLNPSLINIVFQYIPNFHLSLCLLQLWN